MLTTIHTSTTTNYTMNTLTTYYSKLYVLQNFIENPYKHDAPSNLAIMGRYILITDIFQILNKLPIGAGGEIQLIDAIEKLNKKQHVYALDFDGVRHDVGETLGFVKTTIEFALSMKTSKKM